MKAHRPLHTVPANGRRAFLQKSGAAAAAVLAPALYLPGTSRAASKILVSSFGGTYGEALTAAFFTPFTKETGIQVQQTGIADLAKLKAQVRSGAPEWDLMELTQTEVQTALAEGLVQKVDYNVVKADASSLVYTDARQQYWVSPFAYTGGIAYNTETVPQGKHARTWAEFWDVRNFPGRRGLRARPNENLEIATMAAGAAPSRVYPIDVDRAFKALDQIKPAINKWTENAPQSVQLLQTKELDFSYTYHNRVYAAQKSGQPLAMAKDQLLVFLGAFCVPTAAQSSKEAMQLINFMMRPDRQAHMFELTALLPTTKRGVELVPAEQQRAWAPDMSKPGHLVVDSKWWGEPGRLADMTARFKRWMIT